MARPNHWIAVQWSGENSYAPRCIVFVLAQLVEPPLQPGPIRLPSRPTQERRQEPDNNPAPVILPTSPDEDGTAIPATTEPFSEPTLPDDWRPPLKGTVPYSATEIEEILNGCRRSELRETLNACAAALTARLVKDGYVNSRIYAIASPPPGALEVVLGTIAELRISSDDDALKQQVQNQLDPLIGTVLYLPALESALVKVRRSGVGSIKGSMGRLGSDPSKAVINLAVEPAPPTPLQGDLSLSNDGNGGSGEWRAMATLLQNDFIRRGDTGLLFLELDADGELELGSAVLSATYTYPLSDAWSLTGSFGYSYRRFVEFRKPAYDFSFRTLQGLVQLETQLKQERSFTWTAFAGISASRNDGFQAGGRPDIPLVAGGADLNNLDSGDWDPWSRSAHLRVGTNLSGLSGSAFWNANAYLLQGLAFFTPDQHLANLAGTGIQTGQARALGGVADLSWRLLPETTLNLRAAGQLALASLPGSMGFVLGSDVGLRGLPGTLTSSDSGWLGTAELVWTAWQQGQQSLQFSPFIGVGGVQSYDGRFKDHLGSGGFLGRYRNGRFEVELGWVDTFATDDQPGVWNDWVLGNGLYSKLRYSF